MPESNEMDNAVTVYVILLALAASAFTCGMAEIAHGVTEIIKVVWAN